MKFEKVILGKLAWFSFFFKYLFFVFVNFITSRKIYRILELIPATSTFFETFFLIFHANRINQSKRKISKWKKITDKYFFININTLNPREIPIIVKKNSLPYIL